MPVSRCLFSPTQDVRDSRPLPTCLPPRQRSLIRKALADVTPMGQKTTRGVVGNDMVTDEVDNTMDDVDSEPDDDRDFE